MGFNTKVKEYNIILLIYIETEPVILLVTYLLIFIYF